MYPEEQTVAGNQLNTDGLRPVPMPTCGPANYDVRIRRVENGFIVEVGCKTFVASNWNEVSEGLRLYYKDPEAAQKLYCR
jgi:hypothetical protein